MFLNQFVIANRPRSSRIFPLSMLVRFGLQTQIYSLFNPAGESADLLFNARYRHVIAITGGVRNEVDIIVLARLWAARQVRYKDQPDRNGIRRPRLHQPLGSWNNDSASRDPNIVERPRQEVSVTAVHNQPRRSDLKDATANTASAFDAGGTDLFQPPFGNGLRWRISLGVLSQKRPCREANRQKNKLHCLHDYCCKTR